MDNNKIGEGDRELGRGRGQVQDGGQGRGAWNGRKAGKEEKRECGNQDSNGVGFKQQEKLRQTKFPQDSKKFFENLTWLTSSEAAEYLRLPSVGALRVLVCKRRLPFHKLGRSLRFKRAELDRLLEVSKQIGEF